MTLKHFCFFWKQASKSGCVLYTGAHYTCMGKYGIQLNLYFEEIEGLVVEFV